MITRFIVCCWPLVAFYMHTGKSQGKYWNHWILIVYTETIGNTETIGDFRGPGGTAPHVKK